MSVESVVETINALVADWEVQKSAFMTKLRDQFKPLFLEFFAANPNITSVVWSQYTPYFNDGEPCVFGVHGPRFDLGEDSDLTDLWEFSYRLEDGKLPDWCTKEVVETLGKFAESLSQIPDELYLNMFGDHVEVTATRDGFQVDEYSHD